MREFEFLSPTTHVLQDFGHASRARIPFASSFEHLIAGFFLTHSQVRDIRELLASTQLSLSTHGRTVIVGKTVGFLVGESVGLLVGSGVGLPVGLVVG